MLLGHYDVTQLEETMLYNETDEPDTSHTKNRHSLTKNEHLTMTPPLGQANVTAIK
jgi:hypothetical protein